MRAERTLACAVAFMGAALAGCPSAVPPKSQFPSADDALGRMHATYSCAYGVQGTAKIDLVTKKGRIKSEVDIFAVTPESVRFDVSTPVMPTMLYTLTSDGKDFKFADMEQKVFYFGPAKQCNLARFTQVPIPPHALTTLLRGEAPVLKHEPQGTKIAWADGHYVVTLSSTNEATEEIHVEVHPEDFDKPWSEQRVRIKHVRVAQGGGDLYQADLDDHRPGKTAPPRVDEDGIDDPIPPIGPECSAELPYSIRFRVPGTKDDLIWEYKEGEVMWNPPLIQGTFDQPKPGGVIEQHVDCP